MNPIVYLAGGINGLSDADAINWREYAKTKLARTLDPMRRDYRGKERGNEETIVNSDLTDIDTSDAVLAMCPKPSWGTAMEIYYAYTQGIPVYAVVTPGVSVSPWLAYHCKVFTSIDEAIAAILA